ncbi:hypothetical protein DY000_02028873 [Brassica cretica]|uniref:Uncharacterized protein n=1 Tax=Brassica cretica TaxID=69181 RepID=A0ABQ7DQG9_BRACR|nr:hypothetical protein DY000_02028873 [Brassica cretica]
MFSPSNIIIVQAVAKLGIFACGFEARVAEFKPFSKLPLSASILVQDPSKFVAAAVLVSGESGGALVVVAVEEESDWL